MTVDVVAVARHEQQSADTWIAEKRKQRQQRLDLRWDHPAAPSSEDDVEQN
jgi:hypothetical protein